MTLKKQPTMKQKQAWLRELRLKEEQTTAMIESRTLPDYGSLRKVGKIRSAHDNQKSIPIDPMWVSTYGNVTEYCSV